MSVTEKRRFGKVLTMVFLTLIVFGGLFVAAVLYLSPSL